MSAFIDQGRERFGVEPICRTLGVSASAYYQRATGERSARVIEDERLLELIRVTHARNYSAYGYRKLWLALRRAGETVGRDHVKRLMRQAGIQGAKRRGKPWRTTTPDAGAQRPPDLVDRDFTAERPDVLWLADFTYLRCWEGVVFFSFVIDAFSRRVVGWQFASHMRTDLVLDALRMALTRRQPGADLELVHHSDAGSQGGFNRLSQHSLNGRLRWESRGGGHRIGRGVRRSVVGSIASGFGRRSLAGPRARQQRSRRASRGRWVSGGSGRLAGCRRCRWPRRRGGTCRSTSGKRSRCCAPRAAGWGRSRVGSVVRHRRSPGSCGATLRRAAVAWSTEPRPRPAPIRPPAVTTTLPRHPRTVDIDPVGTLHRPRQAGLHVGAQLEVDRELGRLGPLGALVGMPLRGRRPVGDGMTARRRFTA